MSRPESPKNPLFGEDPVEKARNKSDLGKLTPFRMEVVTFTVSVRGSYDLNNNYARRPENPATITLELHCPDGVPDQTNALAYLRALLRGDYRESSLGEIAEARREADEARQRAELATKNIAAAFKAAQDMKDIVASLDRIAVDQVQRTGNIRKTVQNLVDQWFSKLRQDTRTGYLQHQLVALEVALATAVSLMVGRAAQVLREQEEAQEEVGQEAPIYAKEEQLF